MEKLIHERLREYDEQSCSFICDNGRSVTGLWNSEANSLADEIETYYDPKLRFEDGEPAKEGDKYIDSNGRECIISRIDNHARIWDEIGECEYVDTCRPLIRPESKARDAKGEETNVGDTVWIIESGAKGKVEEINKDRVYVKCDDGWLADVHVSNITHREPDSLEKLRDDMNYSIIEGTYPGTAHEYLCRCAKRLTAIMERDA